MDFINKKLGIEPLSSNFTKDWLYNNLKNNKKQLKPLLLDQGFIAGLGNIYVDEALWRARLHPKKIGSTVSKKKADSLHEAIRKLLRTAINNQGTTIINFYFGKDQSGNFSEQLQVFGRQDKNCSRCNKKIIKIRVAQRGTHLCPNCQQL